MNQWQSQLNLSKEERFFSARIENLFLQCEKTETPRFSFFLDLRQQKIASFSAGSVNSRAYEFFGGYQDAERKMFGVFPDYVQNRCDEFPIGCLCVEHGRPLSHRDFLGSLMSLGIKREVIGDILVGDEKSYILVTKAMCAHIVNQLDKIANVGIKIYECAPHELSASNRFSDETAIVSSMRLDCIVAAIASKSRADAARLIEGERVCVNHETVDSCSKLVCEGDTISIRGTGKFAIGTCNAKTKKGRLVLSYKRYI